jgi:hypothetical protein
VSDDDQAIQDATIGAVTAARNRDHEGLGMVLAEAFDFEMPDTGDETADLKAYSGRTTYRSAGIIGGLAGVIGELFTIAEGEGVDTQSLVRRWAISKLDGDGGT